MSATTPSVPLKTAPCPATWDLIEQLVQLESSKNRLHLEYMGKAMPADVYLRFQKLRDERIPALRSQLRVGLAAAPDQPPAHFAHAYADQLMLRCLLPDKSAPQAQPADALDASRFAWLAKSSWYVGPSSFYADEAGGMQGYDDMNLSPEELRASIDAAMAAAQEGSAA